jgi:hypothetical protein
MGEVKKDILWLGSRFVSHHPSLSVFLFSSFDLFSSLQAKYKSDLESVVNKQDIERDIETKKVRTLAPSLTFTITLILTYTVILIFIPIR